MRFRGSLTFEYEVVPSMARAHYGTDHPNEMAVIDQEQMQDDPASFLAMAIDRDNFEVQIEVIA